MKLKKHYRSSGSIISALGLALSATGVLMAKNYMVSADSSSSSIDFVIITFFVGIVVVIASIILMVMAFIGASR
ncbi:MAG: hypothetical protein BWY43_00627 [candidate division WS2 bacterium ADurb.Bin280]|uniref:Uncharacterized protein n=1 Tax=candidate division WS2 bacterium ADurb.Bin280 TaxID=1852829 RepID=A0A1V5SCA0_9BACT|nr:MAG: hypothetical protein BWY43_00627 [candidate division WS2 bacterium ADurb.Bin280]